ncbi:hypothetical protein QYF36_008446 [Acer negundo]|nr:hypothetical protein QYF36_008446 [Acer negundo]
MRRRLHSSTIAISTYRLDLVAFSLVPTDLARASVLSLRCWGCCPVFNGYLLFVSILGPSSCLCGVLGVCFAVSLPSMGLLFFCWGPLAMGLPPHCFVFFAFLAFQ